MIGRNAVRLRIRPAARPLAGLAALLMLLAVGVDAIHLLRHAHREGAVADQGLCSEPGALCHGQVGHLHEGRDPHIRICVACLWHGMGKTPPPAAAPIGSCAEVSPLSLEPVAGIDGGEPCAVLARAPPSA